MLHRPLVFLSGLTVGDYLLWNWSVSGNHDVLALIAGFTLPPLAVASAWLIALTLVRLIARSARRPVASSARGNLRAQQSRRARGTVGEPTVNEPKASTRSADRPSRKLAA